MRINTEAPSGSGLTFDQFLAMVRDDVSTLIEMVPSPNNCNRIEEIEMLLDDVSEKLETINTINREIT